MGCVGSRWKLSSDQAKRLRITAQKKSSRIVRERVRGANSLLIIIGVLQGDHPLAQGEQNGLCTRANMHLHEDVRQVAVYGTNTETHATRYLFIRQPARCQAQYVKFALAQQVTRRTRWQRRSIRETAHHFLVEGRLQYGLAPRDRANRLDQLMAVDVFEQEPGGPCLQ